MILFSKNVEEARVEAEMRQWYRDNFGDTDANDLVNWLWEHNGRNDVRFVDALVHIAKETSEQGPKFVHNLLDVIRKPAEVRDAELQILAFMKPRIDKAVTVIRGHRAAPEVVQEEFDKLMFDLEDLVKKMFPGKHRATRKGAMVASLQNVNGAVSLNVATLVKTLMGEDALAATASTAGRA